jgi:hypothetical protein
MAGHVRLELKNVGANYPFERSRRFRGIKANSADRDYSPLSCGGGEMQLGPSAIAVGLHCRRWRDFARIQRQQGNKLVGSGAGEPALPLGQGIARS